MENHQPERSSGRAALPGDRGRTRRAPADADDARARGHRAGAARRPRRARCARSSTASRRWCCSVPSLADDDGLRRGAALIARASPKPGVVLLAEELTLPLLQEALRAGVRDALDASTRASRRSARRSSGSARRWLAIVHRAADRGSSPTSSARSFVAFSTKGGVGKSVVATNLVGRCSRRTHPGRVALVDADLQFGDVAVLLGIPPVHTTTDAAGGDRDRRRRSSWTRFLATHEASSLRVLCAPVEPSAGDKITPEEMVSIVRTLRHDVRLRRRRHAAALRRRRARAARGGRRRAPRREHGHPEHQEPEGRHPDARPAVARGRQAEARAEPGERARAPRRQRRRTRARRHRRVPHPVRHLDPASRSTAACRSCSTSRARRPRWRSRAVAETRTRLRIRRPVSSPSPKCRARAETSRALAWRR